MKELKTWLNDYSNILNIKVLEENKHLIEDKNIKKDDFIETIEKLKCKKTLKNYFNGDREIYITIEDNSEFTIQVSDFELDTSFELGSRS